jgi:hypothetical protein
MNAGIAVRERIGKHSMLRNSQIFSTGNLRPRVVDCVFSIGESVPR